jgi:hypothetical protein
MKHELYLLRPQHTPSKSSRTFRFLINSIMADCFAKDRTAAV